MTHTRATVTLPPGVYRHYKGPHYEVLGVARHSETQEWLVCYRCLYGDYDYWVRPLDMFTADIEHNGIRQPRFAYTALSVTDFLPQ